MVKTSTGFTVLLIDIARFVMESRSLQMMARKYGTKYGEARNTRAILCDLVSEKPRSTNKSLVNKDRCLVNLCEFFHLYLLWDRVGQ